MKISLLLCVFLTHLSVYADQRPEKPNVILLLTDDLGWQDIKCYDIDEPSPMETPYLDRFAKQGVMFWQAYSPAPTCAPSRCAIMSGNHPTRAQKTHVVGGAPPVPHNKNSRMMDPWYSGRMPANEQTLPKTLKSHGYTTGHSGKWHMAIDHHAFPQPKDQGFEYTQASRGSRVSMKDRLKGFATNDAKDPFKLDENGYPFHQTNEDALTFMKQNKDKPFFLYYATWLVHAPIHTRAKEHLDKYAKKLGVDPKGPFLKTTPGQINPFYCAMVEELDYYVGVIFKYLEETEDPRWPGHKLSENTYIIFTSDNGGMEGGKERYTDNRPLLRGKISAMEGGTRVPLIITGPDVPKGVQTDVLANGLDFYPTILAMTGTPVPENKNLDGCNLLPLLTQNPQDPALVKTKSGVTRNSMHWHFPHGGALESTIRMGDYKLVRNYDHINNPSSPYLELFRLYETVDGVQQRGDFEEAINLAQKMPEKARLMNESLTKVLTEMKASYPSYNPNQRADFPNKEKVCKVIRHQQKGQTLSVNFKEQGAKVVTANLIYSMNGGARYEEWFKLPISNISDDTVTVILPEGTSHYFINLIDENNFLRSYPEVDKKNLPYSLSALKAN